MAQRWFVGDPAPMFVARTAHNPRFHFDTVAGRFTVLCFLGSTQAPAATAILQQYEALKSYFDDDKASFFAVTMDMTDEQEGRLREHIPGFRVFWDKDGELSHLYGAIESLPDGQPLTYQGFTLVLDPMMRVIANISHANIQEYGTIFSQLIKTLPDIHRHARVPMHAPVLILPRVFEPTFCRQLIDLYHQHGGVASGFMREVNGKTVAVMDDSFKRREDFQFDFTPEHETLREAIRQRLVRRLVPEIKKVFQFSVTRLERYIVSRYDAETGGFFRPHRDNTTKGTAHRRFACTINLNAEEFEGGELRFPEFGMQTYRAPTGGAVIFSCSLLHEATPVTKGTRYAFLPFLYDDAAAKIREENKKFIEKAVIDRNQGQTEDEIFNFEETLPSADVPPLPQ